MIRLTLLLLAGLFVIPITVDAEEISAERQAYRERMKARKTEALAERARLNAQKPKAVYGRRTAPGIPGLGRKVEMVYSISQGRMVPSQYQRVAVPSRYGAGYYTTVAPTNPDANGNSRSGNGGGAPMQYQYGDRFQRNADGSITVYRNGVAVGKVGQQARGKKGKK